MEDPRPCERYCPGYASIEGHWRHYSRFHSRKRKSPNGTVGVEFDRLCRDCQQVERVGKKNDDRPLEIIRRRAADHARRAGVPSEFFWVNMNYQALVPVYRAMLTPEARCLSCGHPFEGETDIQIEHRAPPRHRQDWARLHARNLGFFDRNCNGTKTNKAYEHWLDEQEDARQTNDLTRTATQERPVVTPEQQGFDL